jgi:hypothetical protein
MEDRLKLDIQNGHQGTFLAHFLLNTTHLPHHHGDYHDYHGVFILNEHVAMYDNMPYA